LQTLIPVNTPLSQETYIQAPDVFKPLNPAIQWSPAHWGRQAPVTKTPDLVLGGPGLNFS